MADEEEKKKEKIYAVTRFYYSNPKVIEALAKFASDREVVPRYFDGFGKRPDKIQYPSDIMGLVSKGATSFHASEELWNEPLSLNSEMTQEEQGQLRKGWDLLIDVDSKYLDLSKVATNLIVSFLEMKGIKNYGIKFSGSKGFHIIVSSKAFPKEFHGQETMKMFPSFPRAIVEYIFSEITPDFRKGVGKLMSLSSINKTKTTVYCQQCQKTAQKGIISKFRCPICELELERKDMKETKRILTCPNRKCSGKLEVIDSVDYYYCSECKDFDNEKFQLSSDRHPELFKEERGEMADEHAELDLVLVAPRHLFRMPYSLHEKTALASVVLSKDEIDNFSPRDANPMNIKIRDYMPENFEGEATNLLASALEWKKNAADKEEKKYSGEKKEFEKIDASKLSEDMFPDAIKKLLKGLKDGKKRGLFILITFFKAVGFSPEYLNHKIREWNKLNEPQLKEGYIKSQIDWHLKQKRNILPPNYDNKSFYKDLGILDKRPDAKNPVAEISRLMRGR